MSWLPLRRSFQATTKLAPFHATEGDCWLLAAVEIGKAAAGETAPAPETNLPNTSVGPKRASVHATNQFEPFHAAVGQNWSPAADERVMVGPVGLPVGL